MSVMYICPVCLHYEIGEERNQIECSFCGTTLKACARNEFEFIKQLKMKPEFNAKLYKNRVKMTTTPEQQKAYEEAKVELEQYKTEIETMKLEFRYGKQAEGEVHCPYCNSTQVQLVRRKWSLLAGFATNKVDRVCVNCKRKF